MLQQLDHLYRRLATGFSFACLFIGGGVLAAVILPIISLWPGYDRRRGQALIGASFRVYLGMLQALSLLRLEVVGRDLLAAARGNLILANHPSLLDVVMLMALVPNAQCIVKHELWHNRFLGGLVRRAGYIRNDLSPDALIEACRESLANGDNMIIFPEGTRSALWGPPRFRRGFANIATLTRAPIQPVIITCAPRTLRKGENWWTIPATRPLFRVVVKEQLNPDSYLVYRHRGLASRKLAKRMETYYAEQLSHV